MKATTIVMTPTWGKTVCLLEENKSVKILKTDGEKFKSILDAAGYKYTSTEEGEFERFALVRTETPISDAEFVKLKIQLFISTASDAAELSEAQKLQFALGLENLVEEITKGLK